MAESSLPKQVNVNIEKPMAESWEEENRLPFEDLPAMKVYQRERRNPNNEATVTGKT